MRILPILAICFLLLLTACAKPAGSNQSIQDIVSETPDFEQNVTKNETNVIDGTPAPEPIDVVNETPHIYKKCRFAAILYDGCKWTDETRKSFNLKIISSSKTTIPGFWFIITGESGIVKNVKREEEILSGGRRTFNIDYQALVDELGKVKRFEILPIEIINDTTEVACLNQHVYTIPETYCKPSEPIKVD